MMWRDDYIIKFIFKFFMGYTLHLFFLNELNSRKINKNVKKYAKIPKKSGKINKKEKK